VKREAWAQRDTPKIAGDEVIRDMAGHVSKDMLKHYSHIRMEAKRLAVENLASKPKSHGTQLSPESAQPMQNSESVPQGASSANRATAFVRNFGGRRP
jgi:hypothetical protein